MVQSNRYGFIVPGLKKLVGSCPVVSSVLTAVPLLLSNSCTLLVQQQIVFQQLPEAGME